MVLADLGKSISGAIRRMNQSALVSEEVITQMIKEVCNALLVGDVNVRLVAQLRQNIQKQLNPEEMAKGLNKRKIVQKVLFDELVKLLDPGRKPYKVVKNRPNIFMFVGLQGSGKTTTCTKLALYYKRKGFKTCLVCADTFRAGAYEQLVQNATKAKIPYFGRKDETDPVAVAREGVEIFTQQGFEVIIVDTSGRHMQEESLFEEMRQVSAAINPHEHIFVMDASIGQMAFDQASAFSRSVSVGSVILTKLDSHAKGGGALSAVAASHSPIIFLGTGELLENLEEFDPKSFVQRMLGMGDIGKFVSLIQERGLGQPEMYQRLAKGLFTLRDMRDQFQNILKMGPLSQVMQNIPGFSAEFIPQGKDDESVLRIRRFLAMLDSMNDVELDSPKGLQINKESKEKYNSRVLRIARGSGTSVREVSELLDQFKKFQVVVSNFGPNNKLANNASLDRSGIQNLINPKMLQQMGGMNGIKKMINQMGGMEGLSGMMGGAGMPNIPGLRGKRR
eukprot:gnl/Spiro4/10084_TR5353_c0_g1_i1.p1 gnl/Spiro4/10084_TR5353_c0_g1~~gnl/Spiro4/10084_TR5353_c0_g1_i1.p1  ORF type:complete len:506 (-),score=129.90 gnl/Spiro4/10084_TR5353_c0_g1_i1:39-1556(-)